MHLPAIFIIYLIHLYILLFGLHQANAKYAQYQFNIPIENDHLCPRNTYKCRDGKPHFLCQSANISQCNPFQNIPVKGHLQRSFILGHNGIRNKVAEDWNIANMNLVHWSRQLEMVAATYLTLCKLNADHCLIMGDSMAINQNYAIRHLLAQRWPGRIVRSWYLELSYEIKSFDTFLEYSKTHNVANFTQMVWPELEFIGCAAAQIKNSYYIIVCYYYPSYKMQNITQAFKFGKTCSKCMISRSACSYTFYSLCGIDVELPNSAPTQLSNNYDHMILVICLIYFANKFLN